MSPSPVDYLRHMLIETAFLTERLRGLTADAFLRDDTLKRAVVRSLEIIGGAAKHLDADFRRSNSEVDWRAVVGMRDRLIHGYFGVDYDIVWDVVSNKIPTLQRSVPAILERFATDPRP